MKNWNRKYFVELLNLTKLKDCIYAVPNINEEILMHIQILTTMKVSFFLKGIKKSGLIIKMTI